MGHALLTVGRAGLALAAALQGAPQGAGPAGAGEGPPRPHAEVSCAGCHRGPEVARRVGAVPSSSCTDGGCHADGGPVQVRVSTVTFEHRNHGRGGTVSVGCAGCHTHGGGEEPLRASLETCDFCHAEELSGGDPGTCLSCHEKPTHVPVTNQGVPVPHSRLPGVEASLPWVSRECVRCHYDVGRPDLQVGVARCGTCHARVRAVTARGIGSDLHPDHRGVNCTACHEAGGHRVRAMSSSVRIRCAECHRGAHGLPSAGPVPGPEACTGCHRRAHAEEQRLLLGVVPGVDMTPAYKFLTGLTCRSCHRPEPPAAGRGRGTAVRGGTGLRPCTACHRPEYGRVLEWWTEGARQRLDRATAYVNRAEGVLGGAAPDSASRLLGEARRILRLLSAGDPVHNPRATHTGAGRAVRLAEDASRAAGRSPPAPPELGRAPRPGFCSYCHYPVEQRRDLRSMPRDFHEQVMGGNVQRQSER